MALELVPFVLSALLSSSTVEDAAPILTVADCFALPAKIRPDYPAVAGWLDGDRYVIRDEIEGAEGESWLVVDAATGALKVSGGHSAIAWRSHSEPPPSTNCPAPHPALGSA